MNQYAINDFNDIDDESENDLNIDREKFQQSVTWGTDWTVETINNQLERGNIDLYPQFQRRNVWKLDKKSRLIESIIVGLPIPEIILAERREDKGSFIVIDGKQRLTAIKEFCSKDDRSNFNGFKLTGLTILKELIGKSYGDISGDPNLYKYKKAFENQPIRTVIVKNWPDDTFLFVVFSRLNTGSVPLSTQELRLGLYPGDFSNFIYKYSQENKTLQTLLKVDEPENRMRDVELAIRYLAYKNFFEEYTNDLKTFFDNTVISLNKKWDIKKNDVEVQLYNFNKAVELTYKIFGYKDAFTKYVKSKPTRKFNRAIFDIMVYYFSDEEIYERLKNRKDDVKAKFIDMCTTDAEFLKSFEESSKDTNKVIKRFSAWGRALSEMMDISVTIPENNNGLIKLVKTR